MVVLFSSISTSMSMVYQYYQSCLYSLIMHNATGFTFCPQVASQTKGGRGWKGKGGRGRRGRAVRRRWLAKPLQRIGQSIWLRSAHRTIISKGPAQAGPKFPICKPSSVFDCLSQVNFRSHKWTCLTCICCRYLWFFPFSRYKVGRLQWTWYMRMNWPIPAETAPSIN